MGPAFVRTHGSRGERQLVLEVWCGSCPAVRLGRRRAAIAVLCADVQLAGLVLFIYVCTDGQIPAGINHPPTFAGCFPSMGFKVSGKRGTAWVQDGCKLLHCRLSWQAQNCVSSLTATPYPYIPRKPPFSHVPEHAVWCEGYTTWRMTPVPDPVLQCQVHWGSCSKH